jgi:hypothetical protein
MDSGLKQFRRIQRAATAKGATASGPGGLMDIAAQFGDDPNGGRRIVTQAKRPCPPTCQ